MRSAKQIVTTIGDRLLSIVAPTVSAKADRYYCVWETWCGGPDGVCRSARYRAYCCYDDYTGQRAWCDSIRPDGCC